MKKDKVEQHFKIKVIVYHCDSAEEQRSLVEETFFEIVGPYLAYRNRKLQQIKVMKLPLDEDRFLTVGEQSAEYETKEIRLNALLRRTDLDHVMFYPVPRSSHHLIKRRLCGRKGMIYYDNLL